MKTGFAVRGTILACIAAWAFAQGARAEGRIVPDVVYGHKDGMALTFDVLYPKAGAASGAGILWMVSGGWVSQWSPPETQAKGFAYLLDEGYTVFLVRHGSSPRFVIPDAVADVRRAVRFIRMNADDWNIDAERLGVLGASAGGHLSLMLGTTPDAGDANAEDPVLRQSDRVAAVAAYCPPVDLRGMERGSVPRRPGDAAEVQRPLVLDALNFDPALAADYSPIAQVSPDDSPALMVHGDADVLVPSRDSEDMYAALTKAGVATDKLILEGAEHAIKGDDMRRAQEAVAKWFNTHLGGTGKAARPTVPRIRPLTEAEWTPGQRAFLQPRADAGTLYNVFTTFATHEKLFGQWIPFGTYILRDSTLSARDREIAILRIGWLCRAEYEWAQHVRIARTAGVTEDEIGRIMAGPSAPGWSAFDATLLRAVDELHAEACIGGATWEALSETYSQQQMMDLVFTVGQYNLVSMALNSFGVQLDEGLAGFPK